MRVLIANQHRNVVGGVEKYLQAIIPALLDRGHQIALLFETHSDPSREPIDAPELALPAWTISDAGFPAALKFAVDWKPDVVYSHGLDAADLQSALLDISPNVLYAHNYVGTCASGQKCHAFPSPRPCTRQFGLGCLVLYYPRRCGGLHPGTMWNMFRRSAEMNRQLQMFKAVLVASCHMEREFRQHDVPSDKIHVLPLPNPNLDSSTSSPARSGSHGRILFIGRLTKLKGVDHLLRAIPIAARKLGRTLSARISGDGPERERLEALARETGVAADFTGWIPGHRKSEPMQDADLLAVPSLWPEPFGLVGIEAGSFGLPAVAYDVGGISDWLIPAESGELAPGDPPTVDGLADAIARALRDPEHYSNLCSGARRVARRFALDSHVTALEEILESVRRTPARGGALVSSDRLGVM